MDVCVSFELDGVLVQAHSKDVATDAGDGSPLVDYLHKVHIADAGYLQCVLFGQELVLLELLFDGGTDLHFEYGQSDAQEEDRAGGFSKPIVKRFELCNTVFTF